MALFSDYRANNPALKENLKGELLISWRKGCSLKDIPVRAKLLFRLNHAHESRAGLSTPLPP